MKNDDFKLAPQPVQDLTKKHTNLTSLVETEVAAARALNNEELIREAEKLQMNLQYMLKYLISNDIPDLEKESAKLMVEANQLCQDILREYNIVNSPRSYYASIRFQRLRPEENLESLVSDYLSELNRRRGDPAAMMSNSANAKLEGLSSDIFEHIRTIGHFNEKSGLLESLIVDKTLPEADRILWLAGVGMGLLEQFDNARIAMLINAMNFDDESIKVAAAVWLAIGVFSHYTNPLGGTYIRTYNIPNDPNVGLLRRATFELVRLIIINSLSPESRAAKIPSMASMMENLNIPKDPAAAKEMMKSPESLANSLEVYDWMHRFNDAVREGYDVQAETLGKMRHWNFFGKLSNWLLPYDPNHSALAGIADEDGAPLAEMLSKISSLIDADKYALMLSLTNIPASMREAAMQGTMEQMGAGSEEFQDALDDEARQSAKLRTRINNYAKQVWRVFSTHTKRDEWMPSDQFKDFLSAVGNSGLMDDETLRTLCLSLEKLEAYSELDSFNNLIHERTEADDRQLAKAAIHLKKPMDMALLHYLNNHPNDLDLLIEAVNNGIKDNNILQLLKSYEDIDSENIDFLKAYTAVLEFNGMYEEATYHLQALEYIDADHADDYRLQRARNLTMNRQWSEALEAFGDLVPPSEEYSAVKILALWMAGQRELALKELMPLRYLKGLWYYLQFLRNRLLNPDHLSDNVLIDRLIDTYIYLLRDINPQNI